MSNSIKENIQNLNREKIKEYLLFRDKEQQELFNVACNVRNNSIFKNNAELRSVIELSNVCRQACRYCGMGKNAEPYTMSKDEILERIYFLANLGRRTFLLQSGENISQNFIDTICECCQKSLEKYADIKFVLCLGNLSDEQYVQLKDSGATRYLLKFEASNPELHKYCRPNDTIENRIERIKKLIELGFQVGTGNIVGLPKQTLDDLVDDLILTTKLKLSMVSATRFIPNDNSEFKNEKIGDLDLTLNYLAILRILHPECLIPSTTSLQDIKNKIDGQLKGLLIGCNTVTVHDGTPPSEEIKYNIYSKNRYIPQEEYCRKIIKQANMKACAYLI